MALTIILILLMSKSIILIFAIFSKEEGSHL